MASVHKVKLKDGTLVDFPRVGTGLPIKLKDGTIKYLKIDPVVVTPPAFQPSIP